MPTRIFAAAVLALFFPNFPAPALAQPGEAPGFSTFRQVLDHDHAETSPAFEQRYFVSSEFADSAASPVIYFLSAEVSLHDHIFQEPFVAMAKALHAHFVAIENRYYGSSQPDALLTAESMRYLRIQQMLADFAGLQRYLTKEKGLTGPWIVIGGSFGGLLSSAYRLKYPELVIGAVASAAPSHLVHQGREFDRFAADKAGPKAVQRFRQFVLRPIEHALKNAKKMKEYKALFQAPESLSDLDFLFGVGQFADAFVQYFGAGEFRQAIAGPAPLLSFAQTSSRLFAARLGLNLIALTNRGIADEHASAYGNVGTRQWAYQECVEIGLFGTPDPDPRHSLQSRLAAARADSMCQEVFGIEPRPAIGEMNKAYYEPLFTTASNILFVSGSADPVTAYAITPKSRAAQLNPRLAAYLIDGATHMADLLPPQATDSPALQNARLLEIKTMRDWLKQYPPLQTHPK